MKNYGSISDDELYCSFLSGDTSSYDQLMIRYGDSLLLYLNGYLHDWQDAEDMMIEAFARIMAKKPRIQRGCFRAYLFKTGRNLALRFYERRTRLRTFSIDSMEIEAADNVIAAASDYQADGEEIHQHIADEERKRVLMRCLERIDPELREALWLIYFDGLSYAEAASVMGVKVKRIDRLLVRGRQQMKKELGKEGVTNAYE